MTNRRDVLRGIGDGIAVISIGGVGVASANPGNGQGDGRTAEVRVGHLSPDTPAVDVYVGDPGLDPTADGTDPVVSGLEYPTFAPDDAGGYLPLDTGTYDISVTPAGVPSLEAIDIDGFELEANRDYTVLAIGELAPEAATFGDGDEPALRALPLADNGDGDPAFPPADATLVRAVHASPDAGAVDVVVTVDGDEVARLEDVLFGTASPYLELPADAEIAVEKAGDTVLGPIDNPLENGQTGSAYVIGNVTPESGGDGSLGAETDDGGLSAVTTLDAENPSRDRGPGDGGPGRGSGRDRGRGRAGD